eukprot:295153_1
MSDVQSLIPQNESHDLVADLPKPFVEQLVPQSETIKLCANILKINKRNKKQERVLLLTDKAIYNIKSKSIKRRIDLSQIVAITKSSTSTEFTLNIPSEYDYRFDAKNTTFQNEIVSAISQAIVTMDLKQEVSIHTINSPDTAAWTVTKSDLKQVQHREEIVRTVMALDHLQSMGFKSKTARKSLQQNNGNLQNTIQSIVSDYGRELQRRKSVESPFQSRRRSPLIAIQKVDSKSCTTTLCTPTPITPLSPCPSYTQILDDPYALVVQ